MLFLARNSRIPNALWAGALSWWSSRDLVSHSSIFFSLTERIRRRKMFLWTCWLIIWPCDKNSAWAIPLTTKKAISITLVLDLNTLAFLGLGDNALFHSRFCSMVSGSYSKNHDSSPVTTLFSKWVQFRVSPKCLDTLAHAAPIVLHSTTLVPFLHRSSSSPYLP